jgi:hypothetical protein
VDEKDLQRVIDDWIVVADLSLTQYKAADEETRERGTALLDLHPDSDEAWLAIRTIASRELSANAIAHLGCGYLEDFLFEKDANFLPVLASAIEALPRLRDALEYCWLSRGDPEIYAFQQKVIRAAEVVRARIADNETNDT